MNNKEDDAVHSPKHYTTGLPVEVIEITADLDFALGNCVKYAARAGKKDPKRTLEDIQKAAWYVRYELDRLANDPHRHTLDLVQEYIADEGQNLKDWEFSLLQVVSLGMVRPELTEEYADRLQSMLGFLDEAIAQLVASDDQAIGEGQEQE